MAASLRMCLMIHIEDSFNWSPTAGPTTDPYAMAIGNLATVIGVHGAKLSVQFDRWYLDKNDPIPAVKYAPPTSLQWVIANGGNFWVQNHNPTHDWGKSTYMCVMSAFQDEKPGGNTEVASEHVSGRSGGWSFDHDGALPYDWVSITQAMGMRRMNSAVMQAHAVVPSSMRPYGLSNDDLQNLYQHDPAPGLLRSEVGTMRMRPFWMNTASMWFERTTSIYPDAAWVGSVMMIPAAGRFEMKSKSNKRTGYEVDTLTGADLNAALTEIWTTFDMGRTNQNSITRVWYSHLNPGQITDASVQSLSAWVQSVNEVMHVGSTGTYTPYGIWNNMNEIADVFSHTTSFYW